MLVDFKVSNFKSFKDPAILSMEASKDKSLPENVLESPSEKESGILSSGVIYGPNASGKSSLIEAIMFMKQFVLTSERNRSDDSPIQVKPFRLDLETQNQPSIFEVTFIKDDASYVYGFSVNSRRVLEEWLYSYPVGRRRILFERNLSPDEGYKFGDSWKGEAKKISELTRPDALFISVANQFNQPIASLVFDWFANHLKFANASPSGSSEQQFTLAISQQEDSIRRRVTKLLQKADFLIDDFSVLKVPAHERMKKEGIPKEIRKKILSMFDSNSKSFMLEGKTIHKANEPNGTPIKISFDMNEESEGTQKFFSLAGPLLDILDNGLTLVADELGMRLHPLLTRSIIGMFHNKEINRNGAQLLFTSHDPSLLGDSSLFRRDQIWLTEKESTGATSLSSLWDFKPRKGENLMRGYLAGRYGAVPYVD
ncbi:MAG: AAA family ATPase, partial [Deltaproteobacteria bacterium]|nr:AAA family ATPase [Deltaproteobacteria bacterium]